MVSKRRIKVMNKKRAYIIECSIKYVVFALMLCVMLFPFLFMISKSFMSLTDINADTVRFLPSKMSFEAFSAFKSVENGGMGLFRYFKNSFIVVLINAFVVPFTSCMIAFPLSRYKFKGSGFMFALILATSMIPSSVVQVPQYKLFSTLGLTDRLASQYIGAFFGGTGMQIFLIIQFMRALPKELDEAATIDGANIVMIFVMIMMPLCFNIFVYTSVGVAMAQWSNFQGPLIYISGDMDEILPIAAAFYHKFRSAGNSAVQGNIKMAVALCMTLFPAILFFIFQKQMIGGVKLGAVKG